MNLDKILPAFYAVIVPITIQVVVGVTFIGILYGWVAAIQLLLFAAYTYVAYLAAKLAAKRNKDMMTVMFSEWGKILVICVVNL